ncbi:MAG: SDR family NAD(P)-dependent oxidoreductase [Geminicoccaceae bacterium]
MELAGIVAVVTGGASGLGLATAEMLAARGARPVIVDRDGERAAAAAERIGARSMELDVTNAAAAEAAMADIVSTTGTPRLLVNCAGIGPAKRIVGRDGAMPLEEFRQVIEVNLIGTFNMLRVAAAAMSGLEPLATGERGLIVNTASVAAYDGQIGQAAYASSKGGIVGLTLPAARELAGRAIRVMTIAPGLFATPLLLGMPENVQASLAASIPFPSRFGEPSEYADLVAHIAGNSMLNGEVIRLDGALRMAPR